MCSTSRIQFRERYKGYKVPIASLRIGKLYAKLGLDEDGRRVRPFDTIDMADLGSVESDSDSPAERAAAHTEALSQAESESEVEPAPKRRRRRSAKADSEEGADIDDVISEKFVDLVDILPPLPKKGEFDVSTIKKSLYFFS